MKTDTHACTRTHQLKKSQQARQRKLGDGEDSSGDDRSWQVKYEFHWCSEQGNKPPGVLWHTSKLTLTNPILSFAQSSHTLPRSLKYRGTLSHSSFINRSSHTYRHHLLSSGGEGWFLIRSRSSQRNKLLGQKWSLLTPSNPTQSKTNVK